MEILPKPIILIQGAVSFCCFLTANGPAKANNDSGADLVHALRVDFFLLMRSKGVSPLSMGLPIQTKVATLKDRFSHLPQATHLT